LPIRIATLEQLGVASTTLPQCIDNQFVPRHVFEAMVAGGHTLDSIVRETLGGAPGDVAKAYAVAQKTEYVRSLLYSRRVVINRAGFWNTATLINAALGADRAGLVRLMAQGSILPILFKERRLDQLPKFGVLEQGKKAVISLAKDPDLADLICVNLGGDDDDLNAQKITTVSTAFQTELGRLLKTPRPEEEFVRVAQHLLVGRDRVGRRRFRLFGRRSDDDVQALAVELTEVARWAATNTFDREEVYKKFIVKARRDENPALGVYRGGPRAFERKVWIDLIYNSNLPQFLDARTFTPQTFPTPLDLGLSWAITSQRSATLHAERGDAVVDEIIDRVRARQSAEAWNVILRKATVAIPSPHEIDHNDLVEIRATDEWVAMIAAMERHIDSPLDTAGLAEMHDTYRAFLRRLDAWWIEHGRQRREEMAAGVVKAYRIGEWMVGLLQVAGAIFPIVRIPDIPLLPGADGMVKVMVQTTLYVFDKANVSLERSQAVRSLEKAQLVSYDTLMRLQGEVRRRQAELLALPLAGLANGADPKAREVSTDENS
jgi:hypothetical protein